MKVLDAAITMDIARVISFTAMLAYTVLVLLIRFINFCLSANTGYMPITMQTAFNYAYARKRVVNRTIHDRKNAVFAISLDSQHSQGLSGT